MDEGWVSLLGERPIHVVDVGAAGGIQSMWRERRLQPYARYYGFEPDPENFDKLKGDDRTEFFQIALSDKPGRLPFHAFKTVGSLVERADRAAMFGEDFETIEVEVDTLASLRDSGALPGLDVVKTDVERHDYFAIKGAGRYLRDETLAVMSEFDYGGREPGSRFREIDGLLADAGFMLFGVQHKLGALGEVFGGDVLYLKDVGHIVASTLPENEKVGQLVKLYMIARHLGRHAYAYSIAKRGEEAGLWSAANFIEPLDREVFLPDAMPWRHGGLRLANLLSLLAQLLAGRKWSSKAAPRPADLTPLRYLTVPAHLIPEAWRRRGKATQEERYRRYGLLRKTSTHYR